MGEPSCRPVFVEGDAAFIEFEELRHPTLASLREGFVANDIKLGGDLGRIALLTGPNMGLVRIIFFWHTLLTSYDA